MIHSNQFSNYNDCIIFDGTYILNLHNYTYYSKLTSNIIQINFNSFILTLQVNMYVFFYNKYACVPMTTRWM